MGVNEMPFPPKTPVSFALLDNSHLTEHGIKYFCSRSKEFVLITTNKMHPAFDVHEDNLYIIYSMKEASKNGADILLLPECFITGYEPPMTYEKSIEQPQNGICVDNTIILADDVTEGLYYADFDMDAIREYRSSEMMGNTFRKVNAYKGLLDAKISEPFIRDGQE